MTGVQTCALPIWGKIKRHKERERDREREREREHEGEREQERERAGERERERERESRRERESSHFSHGSWLPNGCIPGRESESRKTLGFLPTLLVAVSQSL